jgi:hypothetical protein
MGIVSVPWSLGGVRAAVEAKKAAPLHKAKQRKTIAIFTLTCIAWVPLIRRRVPKFLPAGAGK